MPVNLTGNKKAGLHRLYWKLPDSEMSLTPVYLFKVRINRTNSLI